MLKPRHSCGRTIRPAPARALVSRKLGGVVLDVLEGEPPAPKSPIFDAPDILLTPHMAGSTRECLDRIAGTAAADIARFLQGKRPKYRVNRVRRQGASSRRYIYGLPPNLND